MDRYLAQKSFGKGDDFGRYFGSPFGQTQNIGSLVSLIISNSFVIAGVILLFMLIFAGFSIIIGAGSGNAEKAAKGKEVATAAVIGFILIFVAYWIVRIIEITSGTQFITNPGI